MEWISVKQKLPEFNVDVWAWVIYSDGNERGTETWLEHPENRSKEFGEWAMGSARGYRVTHWMPLPEPPRDPSMPREFENPLSVENVAKICGLGTITMPPDVWTEIRQVQEEIEWLKKHTNQYYASDLKTVERIIAARQNALAALQKGLKL
jgi:hypothetical protein